MYIIKMITTLQFLFLVIYANLKVEKTLKTSTKYMDQYKGADWKKHVKYDNTTYTRNHVKSNEDMEMLVLCWEHGQATKVHNHPSQGCIMKVLDGELFETQYNIETNEIMSQRIIKKGDICYIDNSIAHHKVQNVSMKPVTSLHIYSPKEFIPIYFE